MEGEILPIAALHNNNNNNYDNLYGAVTRPYRYKGAYMDTWREREAEGGNGRSGWIMSGKT